MQRAFLLAAVTFLILDPCMGDVATAAGIGMASGEHAAAGLVRLSEKTTDLTSFTPRPLYDHTKLWSYACFQPDAAHEAWRSVAFINETFPPASTPITSLLPSLMNTSSWTAWNRSPCAFSPAACQAHASTAACNGTTKHVLYTIQVPSQSLQSCASACGAMGGTCVAFSAPVPAEGGFGTPSASAFANFTNFSAYGVEAQALPCSLFINYDFSTASNEAASKYSMESVYASLNDCAEDRQTSLQATSHLYTTDKCLYSPGSVGAMYTRYRCMGAQLLQEMYHVNSNDVVALDGQGCPALASSDLRLLTHPDPTRCDQITLTNTSSKLYARGKCIATATARRGLGVSETYIEYFEDSNCSSFTVAKEMHQFSRPHIACIGNTPTRDINMAWLRQQNHDSSSMDPFSSSQARSAALASTTPPSSRVVASPQGEQEPSATMSTMRSISMLQVDAGTHNTDSSAVTSSATSTSSSTSTTSASLFTDGSSTSTEPITAKTLGATTMKCHLGGMVTMLDYDDNTCRNLVENKRIYGMNNPAQISVGACMQTLDTNEGSLQPFKIKSWRLTTTACNFPIQDLNQAPPSEKCRGVYFLGSCVNINLLAGLVGLGWVLTGFVVFMVFKIFFNSAPDDLPELDDDAPTASGKAATTTTAAASTDSSPTDVLDSNNGEGLEVQSNEDQDGYANGVDANKHDASNEDDAKFDDDDDADANDEAANDSSDENDSGDEANNSGDDSNANDDEASDQ